MEHSLIRASSAPLDCTAVRAAITEYHRLGNLDNTHLFLTDQKTGSPRLRWQIPRLGRILFLIFRRLPSHSLDTTGYRERVLISSCAHKGSQHGALPPWPETNPITSQRSHPQHNTKGVVDIRGTHTHSVHTEWVHNLFSLTPGSILWVLAPLFELSFLSH